jgi:type IV pilus assembly protein PilO
MALMPTDKKQQNILAVGMFALVLAGAFWFLRYKKVKADIVVTEAEVVKLQDIQNTLKNEYTRYGGDIKSQVGVLTQHMKRLEELIPQRGDVPELLNAISEQALNSNVTWGGINPVLEEPVAYYSRQVYDVQVTGGYHEIGAYLAGIASLRRIVKPLDMKLTLENNAKPRPDGSPTLNAKFSIETYVIPAAGDVKSDSTKKGA